VFCTQYTGLLVIVSRGRNIATGYQPSSLFNLVACNPAMQSFLRDERNCYDLCFFGKISKFLICVKNLIEA